MWFLLIYVEIYFFLMFAVHGVTLESMFQHRHLISKFKKIANHCFYFIVCKLAIHIFLGAPLHLFVHMNGHVKWSYHWKLVWQLCHHYHKGFRGLNGLHYGCKKQRNHPDLNTLLTDTHSQTSFTHQFLPTFLNCQQK